MNKLSLKKLDLSASERLQKEQLKSVFGGYGGYGDGPYCELVAEATVASMEDEYHQSTGLCYSAAQYTYAFNNAYNYCMNY